MCDHGAGDALPASASVGACPLAVPALDLGRPEIRHSFARARPTPTGGGGSGATHSVRAGTGGLRESGSPRTRTCDGSAVRHERTIYIIHTMGACIVSIHHGAVIMKPIVLSANQATRREEERSLHTHATCGAEQQRGRPPPAAATGASASVSAPRPEERIRRMHKPADRAPCHCPEQPVLWAYASSSMRQAGTRFEGRTPAHTRHVCRAWACMYRAALGGTLPW